MDYADMTQTVLDAYGYSEAQLAKLLGVSQPTIHRIKTGETPDPRSSTGDGIRRLYNNRLTQPSAA